MNGSADLPRFVDRLVRMSVCSLIVGALSSCSLEGADSAIPSSSWAAPSGVDESAEGDEFPSVEELPEDVVVGGSAGQAVILFERVSRSDGRSGLGSVDVRSGTVTPLLEWPQEVRGSFGLHRRDGRSLMAVDVHGGGHDHYEATLSEGSELVFSRTTVSDDIAPVPHGNGGWRVDDDGRSVFVAAGGESGVVLDTDVPGWDSLVPLVDGAGVAVWIAARDSWMVYRPGREPIVLPSGPGVKRRVLGGWLLVESCPSAERCTVSVGIPGDQARWTIEAPEWWLPDPDEGDVRAFGITLLGPDGQLFRAVGSFEGGWQVWFIDREGTPSADPFELGPGHIDIAFNPCDDTVALSSSAQSQAPAVIGLYDTETASFRTFNTGGLLAGGGLAFVTPDNCPPG